MSNNYIAREAPPPSVASRQAANARIIDEPTVSPMEIDPAAWRAGRVVGGTAGSLNTPATSAGEINHALDMASRAVYLPATKQEAGVAASFALAGWSLGRVELEDGRATYSASRWGCDTANMADLIAVEAFANKVGAPT